MRPKPILTRREALILLAAIWFVGVLMMFYAINKPLDPDALQAIGRLARIAAAWVAVLALANLIGRSQRSALENFPAVERMALQVGLGLGILSLILLGLGAVQLYSEWLLWLLVLLPLPVSLPAAVRDMRASVGTRSRISPEWLFVGLAGGCALLLALAPPTAWDSLVYHLTGPKLYLEQGGLTHPLDLPYLGFPKVGPMMFLLGSALAGPALAQVLHLAFAGLTVVLLPGLVNSMAPRRGSLAAAILVGVPSMWLLAGRAYVEWITAYWVIASLVLIQTPASSARQTRLTGLAGLCAGLALATKYTAIWPVVGLALASVVNRRSLRHLLLFVLAAIASLLPSLLSDWALTGNPVYPFVFDGVYWDSFRSQWFSRFGTGLPPLRLLLAGWEATVFGVEGGFFVGHPSYAAAIGPLLLGLAPLALLRLAKQSKARLGSMREMTIVMTAGWIGWTVQLGQSQLLVQTRLLFPIFPLLAATAAVGYEALGDLSRRLQFVLGGLLAFVLSLTLVGYLMYTAGERAAEVVSGRLSTEAYLETQLGDYDRAIRMVNQLPSGARVRFLWEPRSFYCDPVVTCEPDALLDRWWHAMRLAPQADPVMAAWQAQGVTHVLFYRLGAEAVRQEGFDPISEVDWIQLERALHSLLTPVWQIGDSYVLYRLP